MTSTKIISALFLGYLLSNCSFPKDREDNPNDAAVVHTGNATDTFMVDSQGSATMTAADSGRMVNNDDSSTSGTPSGRGTDKTGNAVGTGTSRVGENHPAPAHRTDSVH